MFILHGIFQLIIDLAYLIVKGCLVLFIVNKLIQAELKRNGKDKNLNDIHDIRG